MKSRNGFTLIEILIVVVLLGILSAVVIPMYAETNVSACAAAGMDMEKSLNKSAQYYRLKESPASWTALKATSANEAVAALYAAGYADTEVAALPTGHSLSWADGVFTVAAE